jgi:hypothetical protein
LDSIAWWIAIAIDPCNLDRKRLNSEYRQRSY